MSAGISHFGFPSPGRLFGALCTREFTTLKKILRWILSRETSRGSRMFILKFAICFSFNFFSLKISYPLNRRKIFYLSFTWNNRPQPSNENNKNTQATLNIVKYKINIWVFLALPTFFTYLWKHRGRTISYEGENWVTRALIARLWPQGAGLRPPPWGQAAAFWERIVPGRGDAPQHFLRLPTDKKRGNSLVKVYLSAPKFFSGKQTNFWAWQGKDSEFSEYITIQTDL